jgi:hypothetical protein
MGKQSRSIWTFRLERYDPQGNRLAPVQVEMRGLAFEGSLTDGDSVRVTGRWRGGVIRASEVENLTTGALVRAKSYKGLMIAALAVFVVIAAAIATFAIRSSNEVREDQERFQQQTDLLEQQFQDQVDASQEQFCATAEQAGFRPAECVE